MYKYLCADFYNWCAYFCYNHMYIQIKEVKPGQARQDMFDRDAAENLIKNWLFIKTGEKITKLKYEQEKLRSQVLERDVGPNSESFEWVFNNKACRHISKNTESFSSFAVHDEDCKKGSFQFQIYLDLL